jgi:hypothetical protein
MSWRCFVIVSSIFNYFFVSLSKVVVEIEALRGFGKRAGLGFEWVSGLRVVCGNAEFAIMMQEDVA